MRKCRRSAPLTILALAALLAGCEAPQGETRLNLALADAPVDHATAVVLQVRGVELQLADGEKRLYPFEPPRMIDVLAASGGRSAPLLESAPVPAGTYASVRLLLAAGEARNDSYVRLSDGSQHPVIIPAEAQPALQIHAPFRLPPGLTSSYTIDLDLRRSLFAPSSSGAPYELRPVFRLVNNAEAGAIRGLVAPHLVDAECQPAVYVFTEDAGRLDDVDGLEAEPVASARLAIDPQGYRYHAAFLPAGRYRVAFTCDAGTDDPAVSNTMAFIPSDGAPVTVEPGRIAALNLGQGSEPVGCERRKPDKPRRPKPDDDTGDGDGSGGSDDGSDGSGSGDSDDGTNC